MNLVLKKLGFDENDRVVIFHADDIGSCQASVAAYSDLLDFGILSSAAAMIPCPWFPAAAELCRAQRDNLRLDMGVHLTLNSEWARYRWGPASIRAPESGLVDEIGCFFNDPDTTQERAEETAVHRELRAQIDLAIAAGIEPTHIDSHIFTLFHPRFLPIYFQLARQYRLPAFMIRASADRLQAEGYDEETAVTLAALIQEADAAGNPTFDHVYMMSLNRWENRLDEARGALAALPAGLSYFIIHPAQDSPELRAMAPDWRCRVADYELFIDERWQKSVAASGVQTIGYRPLLAHMRSDV